MRTSCIIGIDIGGSKIRGALFRKNTLVHVVHHPYAKRPVRTRAFLAALYHTIDALIARSECKTQGIGIGMFGIFDAKGSLISKEPKAPELYGIHLKTLLTNRYRMPILIENDAKTAALGEWSAGAGKGAKSFYMITLGTGVGGAYVKDGSIQCGAFDSAHEIGIMVIDAPSALAHRAGDLEHHASELFFYSHRTTPLAAAHAARQGNRAMKNLWREYGAYLGLGIANIVNILEPEHVILGGAITKSWPLFAPSMRRTFLCFVKSPLARRRVRISRGQLGDNAGVIGAALLFSHTPHMRKPIS